MLNVFISRASDDNAVAKEIADVLEDRDKNGNRISNEEVHANVLVMPNVKGDWKKAARKLIKKAHIVLVIQGKKTLEKTDTVKWEIDTAIKYNKCLMLYKIDPKAEDLKWLTRQDKFSSSYRTLCEKYDTIDKIKERIDRFDTGTYNIYTAKLQEKLQKEPEETRKELFQQYQMYQQTSEKLVERRQSVNSFYISVNAALVAFLGAVAGFTEMPGKLIILFAVSIAGIILDISWLKILEAYGILNASKMKVINLIEKELPLILYDSEWKVMSDKLNSRKYVSFTDSEKRIPRIFGTLYLLVSVGSFLMYITYLK